MNINRRQENVEVNDESIHAHLVMSESVRSSWAVDDALVAICHGEKL